ncbi:unnamed protein product [Paramecium pentaurelia]|uniref:Uncharacterized protein n=1 Tax=Paramecium pentaurelia TaxID=43138 RepID=A0A8S1YP82_9CILI|nr:unnamed protein product [Paramecium pentaurelia]
MHQKQNFEPLDRIADIESKVLMHKVSIFNTFNLYIKLIKQHYFYFHQLKILENNCINCFNWLIHFGLLTFQMIKISELIYYYNIIQLQSCLKIVDENQQSLPIKIISSDFIKNNGSQGVAIQSNSPIIFRIVKQFPTLPALEEVDLFETENNLNQNNFIQTYLFCNYASDCANNVVESPTHLALLINYLEIKVDNAQFQKIQTNILRIFPYLTIEQEVKIKTAYLMIPIGQATQGQSIYSQKIINLQIDQTNRMNIQKQFK